VGEGHDLLAEVGDTCIDLVGRAAERSNACMYDVPAYF